MTSLKINESEIPDLSGKVAILTGGSSGIGLEAARLLAKKQAFVHILDVGTPPAELTLQYGTSIKFWKADASDWKVVKGIFDEIGRVDFAFANAGISETPSFLHDLLSLEEPKYEKLVDVNFRGPVILIKLAAASMKKHNVAGSIVLTSSATAYAPEASLPVYSALKQGVLGLIRSLRSTLIRSNITINGVAPAATITSLLPKDLAAPIVAAGLPVSSAEFVGRALVYSATARQSEAVETYGKDDSSLLKSEGRWNGRVILTLGDTYTEIEGPLAALKSQWFGAETLAFTKLQQAATDQ